MAETQTSGSHAKYDPAFHFFLLPVGVLLLIATIVMAVRDFN